MADKPTPDAILEEAIGISDPEQRSAYLDHVCEGDPELRTEVGSLLDAYCAGGTFLDAPVMPAVEAPGEQEGDQIGPYKLLELIGEGGFGRVWMAEQREPMARRVALKIIKLGMDTGAVLARFEAERQALAMMEHPNIATVFDGGATETGRPYFVMELVRGVSITTYCDANNLPPRERIDLFRKVCEAVQHAHLKGVIHRDLKPSNILVTERDDEPVPKVIDFGVAKAIQKRLTERTLFTRINQWVGTPEYMSPEQAGLGSLDVDTRSDVYTLGVVLYELLTGCTPFGKRELREHGYEAIMSKIREEDPPKPSTRLSFLTKEERTTIAGQRSQSPEKLGRVVHGELDWILLTALERDRTRRYESANALAKDLERYCERTPISAAPPSFNYKAGKLARKHWKIATFTAVVVALVLAGSITSAVLAVWANDAEQMATQRLRHERRTLATMMLRQAHRLCEKGEVGRGLVMFSEGLATARLAEAKPLEEAFALNLAAWLPEAHTLAYMFRHPAKVSDVAVSPDGKLLASACRDGIVRFRDLATGQLVGSRLEHPAPVNVLAFDPKGSSLFTGCVDGVVRLWELSEHGPVTLKQQFVHAPADTKYSAWGGRRGVCGISISKDGARLATGGYDGWVRVWNIQEPESPVRSRHLRAFLTWVAFSPSDNDIVAATEHNWNMVLWDWREDRIDRQIPLGAVPWHFDFDSNSERLAVGLMQKHATRQYDSSTDQTIGETIRHRDAISWVEYSPDGSHILTASADHTVRVWNTYTGEPVGSIIAHPATVTCCRWSPSGDAIVTACEDGIVRVWRTARSGAITTLQQPTWVRDLDFGPDSQLVVTGLGGTDQAGGNVRLWDALRGEQINPRIALNEWCANVVFDPAGDAIYATSRGVRGKIWRYDRVTGKQTALSSLKSGCDRLAISPNGDCLASAGQFEPGVRLWKSTTLEPIGKPLLHSSPQRGTPFSFHIQKHHTVSFAFSADGGSVLTGGSNGDVRFWSTATCEPIGSAKRHSSGISALALASDGNTLAVGGTDHRARLLDWTSGQSFGAAMEHSGRITAVAFTPNGRLILTSSVDGTAKVWHVPTGMPVGPVLKHTDVVNTVKCSPDGRLAGTASDDHTAKIWRLPRLDTTEVQAAEECVEALTGITPSGGDTVRFLSIEEWEKQKSKTADLVEPLLRQLVGKPPSAASKRRWIEDLTSLAQSKSFDATVAIEGTNVDEASQIRAIQLLRVQGTPEAAKAIAPLSATGSDPVRLRAISALQQMRDPVARQIVRRKIAFLDEFDQEPTGNWKILGPDPSHTSFDRRPGTLTIRAQDGEFSGDRNDYKNVFLIPNPAQGGDFQVTTCIVGFRPTVDSQHAALLCWNNADNHLKLSYEPHSADRGLIVLVPEIGGVRTPGNPGVVVDMAERLWLRMTKIGNYYAWASSRDGERFTTHGFHRWSGGDPEFVGLTAMAPGKKNKIAPEIDVSCDFFEVATLPPREPETPPTE